MKTVISLYDRSGVMVRDWAKAGHPCLCLDIQHSIRADRVEGNITYRWADVLALTATELPEPLIMFGFPPCTNGAVCGARDFKRKGLRGLIYWLETFEKCRELCEMFHAPYMIEQPIIDTVIHRRWRAPDHLFDPCDYGDPYTKRTQLWTGGGFVMPDKRRVEPEQGSKMHRMPPADDRQDRRAETPPGFARAVFEANRKES